MFNNSGIYEPDEASTNMVASVNRSQSNSSSINHNLNNFGKSMQQAASSSSRLNEANTFPNFGSPPVDVPAIINSFQAFQTMEQTSAYLPQNSPFTHEYGVPDYFPGINTRAQAEHHINMLSFHQNFLMNASNELQISSEKDTCVNKSYPLNIPQIPTKIYQKSSNIDKNELYNPNPQNGPENSTSLTENLQPKSSGLPRQFSSIDKSDISDPENLSQSESSQSAFEKKEVASGDIECINSESPKNLSLDRKTATDNTCENPKSAIQNSSSSFDKNSSVNNNESTPTLLNNFISERKRKSLEKTVRLIESILIKSSNNNSKSDNTENKVDDPLAFSPEPNTKNKSNSDTDDKDADYSDSDDEVLIKKVPLKRTKQPEKRVSPSKIESTRRSHVIENETSVQLEMRIKQEVECVTVKLECTDFHEIDHNNPFHRDSNGLPRNAVGDAKIVDMDNSLIEATEAIKSGNTSLTYYECPHCSLLLFHPKRFLIHTRWHTFGLLNEKRAEMLKEREDRAREKRQARVMQRINEKGGQKRKYPCKDCDKVFQSRNGMKNHRRRFHLAEVTQCRICFITIQGAQNLRSHMRTHEDKEAGLHQCPNCPKKFKYRHSLSKHADTHLEKTHGCPECSKMFGSVQLVKLHMKTHERMARGTTYHCSYCGKGFYETYNLNVHERTHRNDKPFKCDICESCFVTNSSLKRHHRVSHSGAKPFTCNVCQKCFSTENIRDRHELRVHSDQEQFPYPCDLCPRRYMKPKDLRSHLYKMHSKEKKKRSATSDAEPSSS